MSSGASPGIVCILGMHRGGTSLVARILHLLGTNLGPEEHLMRPAPDNPRGFWENERMTAINDEILSRLGGSWDEPPEFPASWPASPAFAEIRRRANSIVASDFNDTELWGWKDPRNSLTLPFWRQDFPSLKCVVCLRNPVDVALSLQRRNGFTFEKSIRLWLIYTASAIEHTHGMPRLFVFYEDVMENREAEARRLSEFIRRTDRLRQEAVNAAIMESVDKELHHHDTPLLQAVDEPQIAFPAKALYLILRSSSNAAEANSGDRTVKGSEFSKALALFSRHSLEAQAIADGVRSQVESLKRDLSEQEEASQALHNEKDLLAERLAAKEMAVEDLHGKLEEQVRAVQTLTAVAIEKERATSSLEARSADRDQLAKLYEGLATEREGLIRARERAEAERDRSISDLAYIHGRLSMRMVQRFWQLQERWAPSGSLRDRARLWFRHQLGRAVSRFLPEDRPPTAATEHKQQQTLDARPQDPYQQWIDENEPQSAELERQRRRSRRFSHRPLISILMPVYKTPPGILSAAIDSVLSQTYEVWELCIAHGEPEEAETARIIRDHASNDRRVKVKALDSNLGISRNSNAAFTLVEGEFVALLDHDDTLAPFALYEVVELINKRPDLDFIYSDKDMISEDGQKRFSPLFKPAWSPDTMLNANYVTHLTVIRRSLVEEVGGFDPETDGAQDWDLFLRVTDKTNRIANIEKVLYHWRDSSTSVARGIQKKPYAHPAQIRAVVSHLQRRGIQASAHHTLQGDLRVRWRASSPKRVSIIVFTRKAPDQIREFVARLVEKTEYPNYGLVLVTPSLTSEADLIPRPSRASPILIVPCSADIGRSAANNLGREHASADALLFLSDSLAPIEKDWLEEMVSWLDRDGVGVVGSQLVNPNGALAHAGLVIGLNGFRGHPFAGSAGMRIGPFGSAYWYRDYSGVSGDCLLIRLADFDSIGGFDEAFAQGGEDVALCHRLAADGKRTVYTPFALLAYRDVYDPWMRVTLPDAAREQFAGVLANGDPYFNRNLSLAHTIPTVRVDPVVNPLLGTQTPGGSRSEGKTPGTSIAADSGLFMRLLSPKKVIRRLIKASGVWDRYSEDAAALVELFDYSQADLESSKRLMESNSGPMDIKSLTWFLPDFDYAYYGGLHTIFRFAAFLKDNHNIANRFVVLGDAPPSRISAAIADVFPTLRGETVYLSRSTSDLMDVPPSDAGIATLWTTAYALLKFNKVRRKFYFIQDFEPMFYPAGSTYAQAEATYRFGFYGIANTRTLMEIYRTEYGGIAEYFDPAVDTNVFYPDPHPKPPDSPQTVFFYARPGHPRNAFELGARALRMLKERLGDQVRILAAGDSWDPGPRGLNGVIENLGRLTYEETAELYRTCDAGLVMMFTRHPSYLPLELMASGCLVISNHNPATDWLLKDGQNCLLASPSPTSLSNTIKTALLDTEQRRRITRSALDMVLGEFSDWQSQIQKTYTFLCQPDDREANQTLQQHAPSRASLMIDRPPEAAGIEAADDVTDNGERVTPDRADWGYYAHLSIYSFAKGFTADKRVLDAGCGTGYGSHYLLGQGADYVEAIDNSERAIAFCRRRYSALGLHFQAMNLCGELLLEDSDFDIAFSSNVMEHLPSPDAFLAQLIRILRPGGIFIMAVPPIVTPGMLEANKKNPYHITNLTPMAWFTKLNRYFQEVRGYRHWVMREWEGEDGRPRGIPSPASETTIRETDFTFEEQPIEILNTLTSNITAVFVARFPRQTPLEADADESALPDSWAQ